MAPLEINAHAFWTREKIIFDIISKCFKQYEPIKIVTSDGKNYSLNTYEKHLDVLVEQNRGVKNIPNEICVQTTIKRVFKNNKVLFQNNGSSTMQSDADIWMMIHEDVGSMLDKLMDEIKSLHAKGKSLSRNYDLNIYLESPDEVYENLIKNTVTKETLRVYKDNINLKLQRHGIISETKSKNTTRKKADFKGANIYRKFEKLLDTGKDQKKLIKAEQELYQEYFRKTLIYANNPTLKTLADAQFYKIEGYTSLLTLMYLYAQDKVKFTDDMIEIVVLENLSDMLIHLSCTGYIKKSKYLMRATRAMMAIGLNCSEEQRNIIETLYSYSTLFEKTRKVLIDHYAEYDNSVKELLMQILHQVDPSVGQPFDPVKISNPTNSIKKKDIEQAGLKIVTKQQGFRCHRKTHSKQKKVTKLKRKSNK